MATRDILNYLGQKIGELTLPDETEEAVWQFKLAAYAEAPDFKKSVMDVILNKKEMGARLFDEIKAENILSGITDEQTCDLFEYYYLVILMIKEGAFSSASYKLQQLGPYGFVDQVLFDKLLLIIESYK